MQAIERKPGPTTELPFIPNCTNRLERFNHTLRRRIRAANACDSEAGLAIMMAQEIRSFHDAQSVPLFPPKRIPYPSVSQGRGIPCKRWSHISITIMLVTISGQNGILSGRGGLVSAASTKVMRLLTLYPSPTPLPEGSRVSFKYNN